jgi:predicted dehydrogenase/threonine dehydrogenase-like Zn-dependent dehydrogenase
MKKVLQNFRTGETMITESPTPATKPASVLVSTALSLISAGTERMLVEFGSASYLGKARSQPEKVKMVYDKILSDGLLPTLEAVTAKLDQPFPMGYANVGRVIETGRGVTGVEVGDRVVSNGGHAEQVCVAQNYCARVPENVSNQSAVFAVVAAIALQGIRLAKPTVGESFMVTGLGLIGLLAGQRLRANGCRVLGIDFDPEKLEIARSFGIEVFDASDPQAVLGCASKFSRGRGVDGVIISASSSKDGIVQQAAKACRKRGRIVLVGVVGLNLDRNEFYEKELSFQVSCSYGPGKHDPLYEDHGQDYPLPYVRWTAQRNFEAVLDLMSAGHINTDPLVTASFSVAEAASAYEMLRQDRVALGIILEYDKPGPDEAKIEKILPLRSVPHDHPGQDNAVVGALGAGNYAARFLLPAFGSSGALLKTIVSSQGLSGSVVGRRLRFGYSSTDPNEIFDDPEINTVVIATQHDSHAEYVMRALNSGKHVFVEKPLGLSDEEIDGIEKAYLAARSGGRNVLVSVGFNRRFAPLLRHVRDLTAAVSEPLSIVYTCNAGAISPESWVQDPQRGGGRIVGEACHFVDACRFLVGSPIVTTYGQRMRQSAGVTDCHDTASITLSFENGSLATIHYFANGNSRFPKERIEVFQAGKSVVIDNFRKLHGYGVPALSGFARRQNKGQNECCQAFVDAVRTGAPAPVPFEEALEVSRATLDVARQIGAPAGDRIPDSNSLQEDPS